MIELIQPLVVWFNVFGTKEIFFPIRHFDIPFVEKRGEVVIKEFIYLVVSLEVWILYPEEVWKHVILHIQADFLLVCIFASLELSRFGIVPSVDYEKRCNTCQQESVLHEICSKCLFSSRHHVEEPGKRAKLLDVFCKLRAFLFVVLKLLYCLFELIVERNQKTDLLENSVKFVGELLVF